MSQRRRLPNSLRWRAVGWMEMGLSQADAARRLNVSRSVVQRLWDQYQSEDSVSRRPVPGRPRATTTAEDRFLALSARRRRTTTVPQLVADHFQASGRRISATTVRNRLHNAGLYARRPVVCVPLNGRQRRNRLCWAREHVSWTQQQWASVLFTDESRFTMESDSGRLLIWREQRTRYHQSNTVERHSYRGGGILVWAGISLGGHTDLHVFHGGTVTGLRYRDETLDPYVRPYAAAIGNDFILMDDNARPHRARIVEEYLEDHGLERMEWPARSPDLNPIENLWNYLGREVAALNPPPRSLHELKQGLLCVWSSLPIPVSDMAAVAEWYWYRTVACFVTGSSPVPLKTRRVGQRCTLNLSRAETSSRWCGVVVRRGGCQLRCRPRHLTMVQNYVVRRQKPSCS
ncbi:transposable element Tcb2 transposase [Trichonephila clavipes]|nr:transposable element Tcb2 transposase [Trichonephila clavipes]